MIDKLYGVCLFTRYIRHVQGQSVDVHVVAYSNKVVPQLQWLANSLHLSGNHTLHVIGLSEEYGKNTMDLPPHLQWGWEAHAKAPRFNQAHYLPFLNRIRRLYSYLRTLLETAPANTIVLSIDAWDVISRSPWSPNDLLAATEKAGRKPGQILFGHSVYYFPFTALALASGAKLSPVCSDFCEGANSYQCIVRAYETNRSFIIPTNPIVRLRGVDVVPTMIREFGHASSMTSDLVGELSHVVNFLEMSLMISRKNGIGDDLQLYLLVAATWPKLIAIDRNKAIFSVDDGNGRAEYNCAEDTMSPGGAPFFTHFPGELTSKKQQMSFCVRKHFPDIAGQAATPFIDVDNNKARLTS